MNSQCKWPRTRFTHTLQWRIQGRGPGGPTPPVLFLDQTEAGKKKFFEYTQ